jgi:hypothetical protein
MNFAINCRPGRARPDPGHPRDEGGDHAPGPVRGGLPAPGGRGAHGPPGGLRRGHGDRRGRPDGQPVHRDLPALPPRRRLVDGPFPAPRRRPPGAEPPQPSRRRSRRGRRPTEAPERRSRWKASATITDSTGGGLLPGVRRAHPRRLRRLLLLLHAGPPAADAPGPGGGGGRLPARRPVAPSTPRLQGRPGGRGPPLVTPPSWQAILGEAWMAATPTAGWSQRFGAAGTWWPPSPPPSARRAPVDAWCPGWPALAGCLRPCWCAGPEDTGHLKSRPDAASCSGPAVDPGLAEPIGRAGGGRQHHHRGPGPERGGRHPVGRRPGGGV